MSQIKFLAVQPTRHKTGLNIPSWEVPGILYTLVTGIIDKAASRFDFQVLFPSV
jgi:hypothetical protein